MTRYGITVNGRLMEVCDAPNPLPSWAEDDLAFLAKMFPNKTGWKQVPSDALNGTTDNGDGTYTNPERPVDRRPVVSLSRVRFDAVFAQACGEAYYLNALRALATIAATNPATDATAAIARGLAALDNPPVAGIDYPIGDWKNSPNPSDITGALLLGIIAALVNVQGFSDIETKVDQALALWSTL